MKTLFGFLLSLAATALAAEQPMRSEVPAVIYMQYLNQHAPQWLCQQDATFNCLGIPPAICVKGVESAAKRCGPLLLSQWPNGFTESRENALYYGAEYRQCILNDWVAQNWITSVQLTTCEPEFNS